MNGLLVPLNWVWPDLVAPIDDIDARFHILCAVCPCFLLGSVGHVPHFFAGGFSKSSTPQFAGISNSKFGRRILPHKMGRMRPVRTALFGKTSVRKTSENNGGCANGLPVLPA